MKGKGMLLLTQIILYITTTILILIWYDAKLLWIMFAWSFASNIQARITRVQDCEKIIKLIDGVCTHE